MHLHSHGVIIGNLSLSNVYVVGKRLKLANYGLFHLTGNGVDVEFPIGQPHYYSPELIASLQSCSSRDVWALGVLLLELSIGHHAFMSHNKLSSLDTVFESILSWNAATDGPLTQKQRETMDPTLLSFIDQCLAYNPSDRPPASELIHHPFIRDVPDHPNYPRRTTKPSDSAFLVTKQSVDPSPFIQYPVSLSELFYYWKISGGDLDALVLKSGVASASAAISKIPILVRVCQNIDHVLNASQDAQLFSEDAVRIPLQATRAKLDTIRNGLIQHQSVLDAYNDDWKYIKPWQAQYISEICASHQQTRALRLSLSTKESDLCYQALRVRVFYRLLMGFPETKPMIMHEAVTDIPPLLRGRIWAALLNVRGDTDFTYESIDKETEQDTDRQLDLDIPRCHQYNELLSSPIGHKKLKRVLKAWIASEAGRYVYWQGLDSMCAPFVTLLFANEPMAYACLQAFISKFCPGFFVPDNSKIMREFMLAFRYLITYHDPEVSIHMVRLGVGPEFFAISWFMTLYARKQVFFFKKNPQELRIVI